MFINDFYEGMDSYMGPGFFGPERCWNSSSINSINGRDTDWVTMLIPISSWKKRIFRLLNMMPLRKTHQTSLSGYWRLVPLAPPRS